DTCTSLPPAYPLHAALTFFSSLSRTATAARYTLSLHDALPIYVLADVPQQTAEDVARAVERAQDAFRVWRATPPPSPVPVPARRSEEHTSELQSRENLVCRLLLEKKTGAKPPPLLSHCQFPLRR